MITPLSRALFSCVAVIITGYVCRRCGTLSPSDAAGLSAFIARLSLPALLFLSMATLDLGDADWRLLASICLAKAVVFGTSVALVALASRGTAGERSWMCRAGLYAIATTQSNDYALGLPLFRAIWGDQFLPIVYLLAPFQLGVLNPIGFCLMEAGSNRSRATSGTAALTSTAEGAPPEPSTPPRGAGCGCCAAPPSSQSDGWRVVRKVLLSPLVASVIGGLLLRGLLTGVWGPRAQLTGYVLDTLASFRDAFGATALVTLGLSLRVEPKVLGQAPLTAMCILAGKALLLPLAMRAFADVLGVSTDASHDFAFLYGVLPSAPTVVVFARE